MQPTCRPGIDAELVVAPSPRHPNTMVCLQEYRMPCPRRDRNVVGAQGGQCLGCGSVSQVSKSEPAVSVLAGGVDRAIAQEEQRVKHSDGRSSDVRPERRELRRGQLDPGTTGDATGAITLRSTGFVSGTRSKKRNSRC